MNEVSESMHPEDSHHRCVCVGDASLDVVPEWHQHRWSTQPSHHQSSAEGGHPQPQLLPNDTGVTISRKDTKNTEYGCI